MSCGLVTTRDTRANPTDANLIAFLLSSFGISVILIAPIGDDIALLEVMLDFPQDRVGWMTVRDGEDEKFAFTLSLEALRELVDFVETLNFSFDVLCFLRVLDEIIDVLCLEVPE